LKAKREINDKIHLLTKDKKTEEIKMKIKAIEDTIKEIHLILTQSNIPNF